MALMADQEIQARLDDLEGWERSGDSIRKQFTFGDFVGSVEFVKRLVAPAEDMGHHPDLKISWNKVTVSLSTHSQGGITDADFDLAGKIEALEDEVAGEEVGF